MKTGSETPSDGPRSAAGAALGLGTQMAAGVFVFTALGWWIDRRLGRGGQAFTLAGILLGFVYCGYELWKVIRRIQAEDEARRKDKGPPHA